MDSTIEKPKVKVRRDPDLCEQYYHESAIIWTVLKKKNKDKHQLVEFIPAK